MDTTLNQLVYELLELRRAYIKETDPLDKRIVIDWIQTQRARLLEQKLKRSMSIIDDGYVQSLGVLTMQKVNANEVSPVINDYSYLYSTVLDVPKAIERADGVPALVRVGPADRLTRKFTVTTYDRALASGFGKFNKDEIFAFVLGNKICLYSASGAHFGVRYIDVRGVFQDAISAAILKNANWDYDDNYPINKEMIDQMKELIVKTKFGLTLVQPSDKIDNKADDPEGSPMRPASNNPILQE